MYKNNILYNFDKDTELSSTCNTYNDFENLEHDIDIKKEGSSLISKLFINFKEIDLKKDLIVYGTLAFYMLMSIVFGLINKKIDVVLASVLLCYITLLILSKSFVLKNTRYTDIAVWNLYTSSNMLIKSLSVNKDEYVDYEKVIQFSTVLYFISLVIGFVPSLTFISVLCFSLILTGYILSFCNQDLTIIKDSLKSMKNFSPCALCISFTLGITLYNTYALNFVGYIIWLILYKIYNTIKEYEFREI